MKLGDGTPWAGAPPNPISPESVAKPQTSAMKGITLPEENMEALDNLCINTIRILSADAVQNANSGHPGMPMGAAAMAYTLWTRYLKYNPADPQWFDRDRFVLSAGHGSMLLYSLLYLTGYDLPLDELKRFRQWGSKTPGHPERGHTVGVEVATGPLGQGFSNGVGMAMAEAWLAARYNRPGHKIIDHHTYAICGDGDLMEGITQEAASLAGHLRLGKMIYLYDQNHISSRAGPHDLHRRRSDALRCLWLAYAIDRERKRYRRDCGRDRGGAEKIRGPR